MSGYVMRGYGTLHDQSSRGMYLLAFDVDGFQGAGIVRWTADARRARRFETAMDVLQCWHTVSTVHPVRDDGKPNRPLTAYTIEPVPLDDDGHPVNPVIEPL